MTIINPTRRLVVAGLGSAAAGLGLRGARAATPALPSEPVALNVVDVAGQLQLTQRAMDDFAKANPKLVSKITYSQAPAPELPGKIKA
ncbi:MAG TPA: ABC transporter substrate-binding protein, partial [Rhodopila sp.]|nr:ABC transporter substrate-binding protein [Rhodopila sp.]